MAQEAVEKHVLSNSFIEERIYNFLINYPFEDKRTPVEKLRENYIDINIPGRVKKVELPPVDGYVDYIDNGGIPVSTLIERGKMSASISATCFAIFLETQNFK